ncbi:DUF3501 family protein [Candidatus Thiosymbion oneisti]|uniref:DUF3501 family protein n=1 Tax=Candidatus Thiosymbion oneisti TaxID=589554 RepID=UPI001FB14AFF|nr:DUF3501 family protein [Candidatus Thiosymbion oneisti]
MMNYLTPEDLYGLEAYAKLRGDFRAKIMAHKRDRKIHVGTYATLYFEDRLTIQYQIQEMLRIERIFEPEGIADELAAYNPLIPDGNNWKATFMMEYPDAQERRAELGKLIGIEDRVWVQVIGQEKVFAIADEDLERADETKTSSVHFLRFELTPEMIAALKAGTDLAVGIDHSHYRQAVSVNEATRTALMRDLD